MRIILFLSLLICNEILAQPFKLPELKFNYSAYEPYIDAQTMEIHHSKHHQGYVNKLNNAIQDLKYENMDLREILLNSSHLPENIRNNAGGHYNHSLFWDILNPVQLNTTPSNELQKAIDTSFGSLDSLKILLGKSAAKQFGSGWAWLFVDKNKNLSISGSPNQDNPIMDVSICRGIPIIGIDVWEHAYYLKHQNNRKTYLQNIWDILDWNIISNKYIEAINDPFLTKIKNDSWMEMKSFHITFQEMKKTLKNLSSYNSDDWNALTIISANLLAESIILMASERPEIYKNEDISNSLKLINLNCQALDRAIVLGKKESIINSKFTKIKENVEFIIERN